MREPTRTELMLLWLLSSIIFVAVILHFEDYRSKVENYGDNTGYLAAASAIRHADLHDVHVKQFWGVSYATALLSLLTSASQPVSLLLICAASSLAAVIMAQQLWGGWVAGFFAVLNLAWLQTSHLGGAEPLFMVLLLGSFWAARREHWIFASSLASLATITRPVGILALVALGLGLFAKRDYKNLLWSSTVSVVIGILYLLPFWVYLGDPLYQVHHYRTNDWQSSSPIGLPFQAIGQSVMHDRIPWTNLILTGAWMLLTLLGILAMTRKSFRDYFQEHRMEGIFALLYAAFLFTYNSSIWARAEFVRFSIPLLPFVLISLRDWTPKSRALLYSSGTITAVLAAFSAIGIRNIFHVFQ